MTILYYAALVVHILTCLFLIGVVLLQQGKGQDLASAFGGGGSQTAFGPRGSATVLSKATTILAGVFMVTSLTLSMVRPRAASVLDKLPAAAPSPAAQTTTPAPETGAGSDATPQAAPAGAEGPATEGPATEGPATEGPATEAPAASDTTSGETTTDTP